MLHRIYIKYIFTMRVLSLNGLNFPKRIGNKTAFQQARMLSRLDLSRSNFANNRFGKTSRSFPAKVFSFEWSNISFAIDKALSRLTHA